MKNEIYDAKQHIDMNYIERIIIENEGKAIFCFGGGTATEILMNDLLYKYNVQAILDNNRQIWDTDICGIKVCSPQVLERMEIGNYIVLILSKHVCEISQQLTHIGLERNEDFFDIYNIFLPYFRIKKFEQYARKFEEMLERIPDEQLSRIPIKSDMKIGVICIAEMIKTVTWYPMAECLLLRYHGYLPTLIMDHLYGFDDYIYFDGISDVSKVYTDYIIRIIKQKIPEMQVLYINTQDIAELDTEDLKMTEKFAPAVVKWLDSRKDEVFLPHNMERLNVAKDILQNTMRRVKYFFKNNKFDVINVYTGIHRHRCVYNYIGHKYGMRVSTYDGDENGTSLYETDGVSGHSYDVTRVIKENKFTDQEKRDIIILAKADFEKRKNSTVENEGYNYQTVLPTGQVTPYDIVIPLNISWDSAALAVDNIFKDEIEWLNETLFFLMKNTDATVMIREHPAQNNLSEFIFQNYSEKIPLIKKYSQRIKFVSASDSVNTYQYLELCKVVLPYSSTVGIEAAMLGKKVILHTDVYYDSIDIAYKAKSKSDYYEKIKECLYLETSTTCKSIENAYLAYFFQRNHPINTLFNECFTEWMDKSLQEIDMMEGVDYIINIITKDETAIYKNIKHILSKCD